MAKNIFNAHRLYQATFLIPPFFRMNSAQQSTGFPKFWHG